MLLQKCYHVNARETTISILSNDGPYDDSHVINCKFWQFRAPCRRRSASAAGILPSFRRMPEISWREGNIRHRFTAVLTTCIAHITNDHINSVLGYWRTLKGVNVLKKDCCWAGSVCVEFLMRAMHWPSKLHWYAACALRSARRKINNRFWFRCQKMPMNKHAINMRHFWHSLSR